MDPGGGSGWDEPPLDIQVPDDARELDRDVLAYHRELRAKRRRSRLRRLAGPFAGQGTIMPLLASILAVCLVAGAMLSVATFSPATGPAEPSGHPSTPAASAHPASSRPASPAPSATASGVTATGPAARGSATTGPSAASSGPSATSSGTSRAGRSASPSASSARPGPSGSASAAR